MIARDLTLIVQLFIREVVPAPLVFLIGFASHDSIRAD